MENTIEEVKKVGNKINLLGRKLVESERNNLDSRSISYIQNLEEASENLQKLIAELRAKV